MTNVDETAPWLLTGDGRAVYQLNERGTNHWIAQFSGDGANEAAATVARLAALNARLVEALQFAEDELDGAVGWLHDANPEMRTYGSITTDIIDRTRGCVIRAREIVRDAVLRDAVLREARSGKPDD